MAADPLQPLPVSIPAPEAAPLSEGARIVNTFIAPSRTFTDLSRNASWWAPFLLLVIVSTIFAYSVGAKVGYGKAGENVLQLRPKQWDAIQNMKADERDRVMQKVEKQTMIGTYMAPVINLIVLLIVAGVLLASFKFGV